MTRELCVELGHLEGEAFGFGIGSLVDALYNEHRADPAFAQRTEHVKSPERAARRYPRRERPPLGASRDVTAALARQIGDPFEYRRDEPPKRNRDCFGEAGYEFGDGLRYF